MRLIKRLLFPLIVLGLIAAGAWWYTQRDTQGPPQYRTATVSRGNVVATIGATGTLEPEEVIDVGAQVTGQIVEFGKDTTGKTIDYGSPVQKDAVVARLDDAVYAATYTEAQAQLAQSKASVLRAKADRETAKAKLYAAQRDWERAERIGPSDALAQSTYDNYKSAFDQAKASVAVAEAAVTVAEAAVDQSDSAVKRAKRNLDFTVIKSPETGTVIDRRVNIGQTVTSSMSVASLFLIARDLKRMQVWVSVNEADIGQIRQGQPVSFTVDAFPGETFTGEVGKIRLNASMSQNVVTYTVEVNTENPKYRLLPYLTANVLFETSRRDNVLMVPNAALRWSPNSSPSARQGQGGGGGPAGMGGGGGGGGGGDRSAGLGGGGGGSEDRPAGGGGGGGGRRFRGGGEGGGGGGGNAGGATTRPSRGQRTSRPATVWVREGEGVRPIEVRAGLTDGTNTEISGEGLTDGLEVVIGEISVAQANAAAGATTNPFVPQMPGRGGRGGGGGGGGGGGRGR